MIASGGPNGSSWGDEHGLAALDDALLMFDWPAVDRAVEGFVRHVHERGTPIPEDVARHVLTRLRRRRRFEPLCRAAAALIAHGSGTLSVRQDHAQGLLDLGRLDEAFAVLEPLVRDAAQVAADTRLSAEQRSTADFVHSQARGLVGRLHKQRYVDAAAARKPHDARVLGHAIEAYFSVYDERPGDAERRWHAINAVALACRAARDGVPLRLGFDPAELARALIRAIDADRLDNRARAWDLATATEACLASKGLRPEALGWAARYVAEAGLDAFEVASTRRQLLEVWQLGAEPRDAELIALLQARLLNLQDGELELDRRTAHGVIEAPAPTQAYIESYRRLLSRAGAVARIEAGEHLAVGTGVLVRGGDLAPALGDERLLLTNAHVTARPPAAWYYAVTPERIEVVFGFAGGAPGEPFRTRVREVVWQSGPDVLDACLLRVQSLPGGVAAVPIEEGEAPVPAGARVFLAGYPRGGGLQLSLAHEVVVDCGKGRLRYRALTDKGSSGSPVLDESQRMVALHHEGSQLRPRVGAAGFVRASEGTRLSAIAAQACRDLTYRDVPRG